MCDLHCRDNKAFIWCIIHYAVICYQHICVLRSSLFCWHVCVCVKVYVIRLLHKLHLNDNKWFSNWCFICGDIHSVADWLVLRVVHHIQLHTYAFVSKQTHIIRFVPICNVRSVDFDQRIDDFEWMRERGGQGKKSNNNFSI